jgi:transcriptional regulator with XRE-family HTH domain
MLLVSNIGDKIKDLREYYGISQKALCEGICSQAYISRLEKGEINVSADILFLLSRRLGVDVNFFFEHYNSSRSDYISITIDEINESIRNRDYNHAFEMVNLELKNPEGSNNIEVKQFLNWARGICVYHLENDVKKAIEYIDRALSFSLTTNRNYSEREIEILLSKAIILYEAENYKKSRQTFEVITYNLKQNMYLTNPKIHIRTYYNYMRLLYDMEQFHEAISMGKKGLHHAEDHELLYLMGDLYFQIGRCYEKLEQFTRAIECFERSKNCFQLNNEERLFNLANMRINQLKEK